MNQTLQQQIISLNKELEIIKKLMSSPHSRPIDAIRAGSIGRQIRELKERLDCEGVQ